MFLLVSVRHVAWRLHTNLYKFRENISTDISYTVKRAFLKEQSARAKHETDLDDFLSCIILNS